MKEDNHDRKIKLIECPRDAMQGWKTFIPTEKKISYLNQLLKVGFDTLDFGSFVSEKAIPQMSDTKEVLSQLDYKNSSSKLLAIIANLRGAEEAVQLKGITYLGYPFSISETFQLRNTNKTISQSLDTVKLIQQLCIQHSKQLVIYISMGFGNPYGDPYNKEVVLSWTEKLHNLGIRIISLADTVGVADVGTISYLFSHVIPSFPDVEFGAHFHSSPRNWEEKIDAAYNHGCLRFDSSVNGIGGCPMAEDELVGNMATENLLYYFEKNKMMLSIDKNQFKKARKMAGQIFISSQTKG